MANFPCSAKTPVRAKPDGPTPVALRANRSLTAPAAHRLRALSFSREHHRSSIGTSQTCRGCRENFSLPGRGAAPHTLPILLSLPLSNQSACASTPKICINLRNLRFPFWRPAGGSRPLIGSNRRNRRFLLRVSSWFFVVLCVSPAGQTFHFPPTASPVARLPRAPWPWKVWRFAPARSVLCSPFSLFLGRRSHKNGRFNAKPKKSACISELGVVSYEDFLMESAYTPPMRKARAPRVRVRLCLRSSVGRALPW